VLEMFTSLKILYLTIVYFRSKIKIGNGETTNVVCLLRYVKKHISNGQITDVFFIGYFCLLIITTSAIIKANVMIVTDIKPVKSNFIINNNICTSTIRLTSSYVGGKPHLFILISYK